MQADEIVQISTWAVDAAGEYRVSVSKITQLYEAIRKHHGMLETKNIIEKGFVLARGARE